MVIDYGHIDIIFNNAGVDNGAGRIHEYPVEVFDKIMYTSLLLVLRMKLY
jgi:NAD(P)-dependent dehydrogenase (short-subunit alcohol dehydrogenase family)